MRLTVLAFLQPLAQPSLANLKAAFVVDCRMVRGDPRRFRLRALQCRQRAGTAIGPKDKASWHELERVWLELAVRVEADEKLGRHQSPSKPH
jgi:hypothetical protein